MKMIMQSAIFHMRYSFILNLPKLSPQNQSKDTIIFLVSHQVAKVQLHNMVLPRPPQFRSNLGYNQYSLRLAIVSFKHDIELCWNACNDYNIMFSWYCYTATAFVF